MAVCRDFSTPLGAEKSGIRVTEFIGAWSKTTEACRLHDKCILVQAEDVLDILAEGNHASGVCFIISAGTKVSGMKVLPRSFRCLPFYVNGYQNAASQFRGVPRFMEPFAFQPFDHAPRYPWLN